MARENQGLQIALIISVMLTIILGVATFLCYRQYTDTAKSLKTAQDDARRSQREADKYRDEGNQLRRYLGATDSEGMDTISKQFDEDMKRYGSGFSPEVQFYRPLMAKLFQTVQDRDRELARMKDDNQSLNDKYDLREAGKDGQLKQFDEKVNQITKDLNTRTETFRKQRDQLTDDQNKIKNQLQDARKEIADTAVQAKEESKKLSVQLDLSREMNKKLRTENTSLTTNVMDIPDGEITLVNQRDGTVWINVGRLDNLNIMTTFSVYPADITDLAKGAKKASIEVTKILGDHLAEARILEDSDSDPILPGEKIHTPIWSPGDQRHFALAGIMDIKGDGRNDLPLLRNLITINGGVIDCEINESGKKVGDITLKTRYIVLGGKPTEKSQSEFQDAYDTLVAEADNLGIPKISLSQLLYRMGFRPQSQMVGLGSGANPKDFKPKPDKAAQTSAAGNVNDTFKPRQPPRDNTGGAY